MKADAMSCNLQVTNFCVIQNLSEENLSEDHLVTVTSSDRP